MYKIIKLKIIQNVNYKHNLIGNIFAFNWIFGLRIQLKISSLVC